MEFDKMKTDNLIEMYEEINKFVEYLEKEKQINE